MPWPAKRAGSTSARLVAELVEPERVGQPPRRVDRHDRDASRRARPGPSRARPTSSSCRRRPSPAQIDDPLAVERAGSIASRRASSRVEPRERIAATSAAGDVRHRRRSARSTPRRSRAQLRALRPRARVHGQRGAHRGELAVARCSAAASSAAVRRSRRSAVDDDEREVAARWPARSASRSASVSLTGISSGGVTATIAVRVGSASIASMMRPWRAIGPTPRRVGERLRGAASTATPCPVAGASTITRSYGSRARRAALVLRELPDLADGQQLAHAGRRRGEVGERAARDEQLGQRARAAGRRGTPPCAVLRVDRDVVQRRRRASTSRRTAGCRRARASRRRAPRPRRRSCAARGGRGDAERRRHRRLADAALAGHDEQPWSKQRSRAAAQSLPVPVVHGLDAERQPAQRRRTPQLRRPRDRSTASAGSRWP